MIDRACLLIVTCTTGVGWSSEKDNRRTCCAAACFSAAARASWLIVGKLELVLQIRLTEPGGMVVVLAAVVVPGVATLGQASSKIRLAAAAATARAASRACWLVTVGERTSKRAKPAMASNSSPPIVLHRIMPPFASGVGAGIGPRRPPSTRPRAARP